MLVGWLVVMLSDVKYISLLLGSHSVFSQNDLSVNMEKFSVCIMVVLFVVKNCGKGTK
jgi:hypothetical protein